MDTFTTAIAFIIAAIWYGSLLLMRFLGVVGVIGLIAYPFGWYRHDLHLWLLFVVLGVFGAWGIRKLKGGTNGY